MKKIISFFQRLLPHLVLILSLMMLTLFCLDRINPSMAFLSNSITKTLLGVFFLFSFALSLSCILQNKK